MAEAEELCPRPPDAEDFRYQEVVFIGLNICSLAVIAAIHLAFMPWVPATRSAVVLPLLFVRSIEQASEAYLLWKRVFSFTERQIAFYASASIWVNIAFAFTVSILSSTDEAHFIVLLMVPLVQACFRYRLRGVIAIALLAMGLNFLELWAFYYFHAELVPTHKPLEHQFELATTALVYPFIGVLVHLLVRRVVTNANDLRVTVDELRTTQQELVEKEKLAAVGRLVNVISHELRHPVAVVTGALDAATRKQIETKPDGQFIEMAKEQAKRLDKLTKDLLTFARPKEPEKKCVSARRTLECVRDLLSARKALDGPRVNVTCESDFDVLMDGFQMQQALLNLATNALNYTEPSGVIVLGAVQFAKFAEFCIENPGDPIPNDVAARIFEPFFTTREEGSGLGLAISKKISENHGGTITLAVNGPDRVRFVIRIPIDEQEGDPNAADSRR